MKVDFRTQEMLFTNAQTQVEEAKSIGEQLSRDLELYADRGAAGRSSSFRSLARFWLGIIGLVCAGAATLEVLGPPPRNDHASNMMRAPGLAGNAPPDMEGPRATVTPDPPVAAFYRSAVPARPGSATTGPKPAEAALVPQPSDRDPQMSERQARSSVADPTATENAIPHSPNAVQEALQAFRPAVLPTVSEPRMVTLPGTTLRMGSNDDHSERPVHTVLVEPFLMARAAVTVQEWQECVDAKVCTVQPKGRPDQPVTNVSWDDASQYAAWLSSATGKHYRLPTEAEWEYAARAGTETRYSWGNAMMPGKASCKGCGEPVSMQNPPAIEAYPPNPFGLFGMGGGVAEWVADCWHRDYQDAPRNGSNAWDAPDCRERVLRGGSWVADGKYLRPSSRDFYDASVRYPTHGFRVAQTE
jgi:formylglycine-generating enzyme required for sulfatase activity